jgi:hypothetical protein
VGIMRNIDFEKIKDYNFDGGFLETKISSELVETNVCENIKPSFEKRYVELF